VALVAVGFLTGGRFLAPANIPLAGHRLGKALSPCMLSAPSVQEPSSRWRARLRGIFFKGLRLFAVGLVFGWAYVWVAPRVYRPEPIPGFWIGAVHGAIMPIAFPSLLLGHDVRIYAAQNAGRTYKLGYITGINACGFVFFGLSFWQPAPRRPGRNEDLPSPSQ
jgi:hypothetical protein